MKKPNTRSRKPLAAIALATLVGATCAPLAALAQSPSPAASAPAGSAMGAARALPDAQPLVPSARGLSPDLETIQNVPANETQPVVADHARLLELGGVLYSDHCMSCHGEHFRGTSNVPSLLDAGGAAVSFYISTGRMPGAAPGTQSIHEGQHFDPTQTAALVAYVNAHARTIVPIPDVRPDPKLLVRGRQLFEDNCEMCHGASGEGAIVGYGWVALDLSRASPTEIGEAIRVGPGVMPRFTPQQLSDDDISALATYVHYIRTSPQTYGGTTGGNLGVVVEGFVAAVFGVGGLFWVIYFTGTKTTGTRVHESS